MDVFFWQIVHRSLETEFIFSLFHCLLASLALLMAYGLRRRRSLEIPAEGADQTPEETSPW